MATDNGQTTLHLPKTEAAPATPSGASERNDLVLVAPTPELNPRNETLRQIAERANSDADMTEKETVPETDEDGNPSEPITLAAPAEQEPEHETPYAETATAEAPALASAFNADQEYDLIVNGKPMKVKGSQIIERGKQAIQKEIAADRKLELASNLLAEVQGQVARMQPPQQGAAPAQAQGNNLTDEQLAEIIQYGTKEQAAQAIGMLRTSGQSMEGMQQMAAKLPQVVRDQLDFHEAAKFVQSEYGDILEDPYLKQMFFMRENHLRQTGGEDGRGDKRPYKELYKDIGEDLRSHFNRPKTTPSAIAAVPKTRDEKVAAKAAAPSAPKLASARLEAAGEKKPPTREEIIERMKVSRGQGVA